MPTVASLQSGLLNDEEHTNGVSCLLNHLLMFALDDPGVPCPKEVMHYILISFKLFLNIYAITNTNDWFGVSERIENGQMMTFIAEWSANFAANLRRTFTEMWTLPRSQIGY